MSDSNGSDALAIIQQIPPTESAVAQWRRTTDIAGLVRQVVLSCTVSIQGRKYLTVAGYQAVANAFGCVASARDVVRVEGGWQAVGEVRRMSDGMVLATGTGFLGDDEGTWKTRPQFSKMAMAQTRACGRALRAAFAFMAPVIDGNLQTTPAEEMELVEGSTVPPAPAGVAGLKAKLAAPPRSTPPERPSAQPATHDRNFSLNYGNGKGIAISQLDEKSLKWYQRTLGESVADPDKARFAAANTLALSHVNAELGFRGVS